MLIADDADKNSRNQVFLNFLYMLRKQYLARKSIQSDTFHSVILAGVYDVKSITPFEDDGGVPPKTYNALRDIATDYRSDMSFSPAEIAAMLREYKEDYKVNMDITAIVREIYGYTSGYPFLALKICKCIDEDLDKDWTADGVQTAVNILLSEKNAMLQDLIHTAENDAYLYSLIYSLLITGEYRKYDPEVDYIISGETTGLIKRSDDYIIGMIAPEMNSEDQCGLLILHKHYE